MRHRLYREQQLACTIDEAWDFFSSPFNLSVITPKDMNFVVKTPLVGGKIYQGMIIDYTVSPLLGIPMAWQTEITQVTYKKSFTDFQKKGPYKLWNHHHTFTENGAGVLITDEVNYELPFGFLGDWVHTLMVKSKLKHIFDYRYAVLENKFNKLSK